jgi:hypothetical protein
MKAASVVVLDIPAQRGAFDRYCGPIARRFKIVSRRGISRRGAYAHLQNRTTPTDLISRALPRPIGGPDDLASEVALPQSEQTVDRA